MQGRLGVQSAGRTRLWWRFGRLHVVVALGLAPLTLVLFQRVSLVSPLANFVAVPWVEMLAVPPALIGVFLAPWWPTLAQPCLALANLVMEGLWPLLQWCDSQSWAQWSAAAPPTWALLAGGIGVAWLLAPRGWPGRAVGVVWLLPLAFLPLPRPAPGEVWFSLLDVGQGLSAVVRTAEHTLVYDAGPRPSERFDAGSAVVAPFLRASGVTRLDMLMVGHDDIDHAGGVGALLREYPASQVRSSVAQPAPGVTAAPCVRGMAWQWDGVNFEILSPDGVTRFNDNNGSCVLRIGAPGSGVLLTGDIEKAAEANLVAYQRQHLPTTVLVAPHHGSRSSSTAAFINAVQPLYVLFPVGYRNRHGHPRPEIVARYRDHGAVLYDSVTHGALTFRFDGAGQVQSVERYRLAAGRYWNARE